MSTEHITGLLREHPFTEGFWPEHIDLLAGMAAEVRFKPGELVFHEGDRSSLFYLLISGLTALETLTPGRALRVSTLYPGEVVGWSSVVGSDSKQFQVRALEEVHALAFDGARLRHACEADFAFGFAFMRSVLKVTADRLHAIRMQLVDVYTPVSTATAAD